MNEFFHRQIISNLKKYLANTIVRCALLSVLIVVLVYLDPGNQIQVFEWKTLDARFRFFAAATDHTKDIVILNISEESINKLEPIYGTWPWPRSVHGEVVDYLVNDGAKAIAFDLIFSEQVTKQAVDSALISELRVYAENADIKEIKAELIRKLDALQHASSDESFVSSVGNAGNVFLPSVFYVDENELSLNPGLRAEDSAVRKTTLILTHSSVRNVPNYKPPLYFNVITPFDSLSTAARGVGHINLIPDKDGPCRRFFPLVAFQDGSLTYPSLSLIIAAYAKGVPVNEIKVEGKGIIIGNAAIPLLPDGSAFINYQGGEFGKDEQAVFSSFYRHYPYHYVLASKDMLTMGKDPILQKGIFNNKIVLIGSTAAGLKDVRTTPFSPNTPGTEIHANIIDNILSNRFLQTFSLPYEMLYVLLLTIIVTLITSPRGPFGGFIAAVIAIGSVGGIHWKVFNLGVVLPIVKVSVAMLLGYLSVLLMKYTVERREKQFIHSAFGMYLAPAVLETVLKSPEKLKLGGEKRYITILFSDIEGFTSLTESLPSEDVVTMLNEYFTEMVSCIAKTNGTLDKFVGDAILAEWNAPADQPEHAAYACETALLMMDALKGLQEKWLKENKPLINIRIGMNTGEMIVGNIGAENIFDYTAIGNEANTAARFEALNKEFGTRIIISDSTYAEIEKHRPDEFVVRKLAKVIVKGRTTSVVVYELVGRKRDIPYEKLEVIHTFHCGMDLFMERKFNEARRTFELTLEGDPHDEPAKKYVTLCTEYEKAPPQGHWTGEYIQESK